MTPFADVVLRGGPLDKQVFRNIVPPKTVDSHRIGKATLKFFNEQTHTFDLYVLGCIESDTRLLFDYFE